MSTVVYDLRPNKQKADPLVPLQDARAYLSTHIRIEAPGYMTDAWPEQRDRFFNEVTELLAGLGFQVAPAKFSAACPEADRGAEHLYCHPQDLSGYLTQASITEVVEAIAKATTFELRWVDTYETAYRYSEEEFTQALEKVRPQLEERILQMFVTKRRNLYRQKRLYDMKAGAPIMRNAIGKSPFGKQEAAFIEEVFRELLAQGQLIEGKNQQGEPIYRTRTNKDDQEAKGGIRK